MSLPEQLQQSDPLGPLVWKITSVVVLGSFLSQIDATVVNVSLSTLAVELLRSVVPDLSCGCRHGPSHSEPLRKHCAFGRKDTTGVEDRILAKEARLKALWNGRLGHQMEALPQYDEVYRTVRRELRQAGYPK